MSHSITLTSNGKRVVRLDNKATKFAYSKLTGYEVWVSDRDGAEGTFSHVMDIPAERLEETVLGIISSQQ